MKSTAPELQPADALILLLTIETLLFTALSIVLSLNDVRGRVPNLPLRPKQLGYCAVGLVAVVGCGGLAAWASLFASPWPTNFTRGAEAAATLVGIIAQPIAGWVVARGLDSRS